MRSSGRLLVGSALLVVIGSLLFSMDGCLGLGIVHCVLGMTGLAIVSFRGMRTMIFQPRIIAPPVAALLSFVVLFLLFRSFSYEVDLSESSSHSLTPGTERILALVKSPLHVYTIAAGEMTARDRELELLHRFQKFSSYLKITSLDPVVDFSLVKEFDLRPGDRLVIQYGRNLPVRIQEVTEETLAHGIERSMAIDPIRVLFSTGHGELELHGKGPFGASRLLDLLEGERVEVTEFSLAEAPLLDTPKGTLLLMLGLEKPLSEAEELSLSKFVGAGGNVLLTVEEGAHLPQAFRQEGVLVQQQPILRLNRSPSGEEQFSYDLSLRLYPHHPVTRFLPGQASVLFSRAYALERGASSDTTQELLRYVPVANEGGKNRQPLVLGLAIELKNGSRLQVFGDTSWLQNRLIEKAYNTELFRGALLWGGAPTTPVQLRSRAREDSFVEVSTEAWERTSLFFLLLLEVLVLLFLYSSWKRRQRNIHARAVRYA